MKIDLSQLRLPAKPTKPEPKPRARLAGESHPFKEMGVRNLTRPQNWDPQLHRTVSSRPVENVHREISIDEKFQNFLAGEVRQRQELRRQMLGEQYRSQFLLNCMSA